MNFLEKLDFLMERYGLNKRSLSQKSDIPYTTIDGWYKKGYEGLKLTTLRKIAEYFNTTLDYWILDEITDPNYGKTSGFKVEYEEMEHIKKYRFLDDFGRESVDLMMDRECKRVNEKRELEKELTIQAFEEHKIEILHRLLPYQGKIASAGTSVSFADIMAGVIEAEENDINRHADYTIGVNGDSMEPEFYDGDIVYVQKATELKIGEIGIFQKDNNIYIKKVGANQLISLNDKYKPLSGEDVLCLGKVVGKVEGAYTIRN